MSDPVTGKNDGLADSHFIAAASPDVVLSLLDDLDAAERDRDRAEARADEQERQNEQLRDDSARAWENVNAAHQVRENFRARNDSLRRQLDDARRTLAEVRALANNWHLHGTVDALSDLRETLAAASPVTESRNEDECEHTEHAVRGSGRVGRRFPKDGPDVGIWEPCPRESRNEPSRVTVSERLTDG